MAGQSSEESNESFNAVLTDVKRLLRCTPATVGRVNLVNARTQANLNGHILEPKMKIMEETKGWKEVHSGHT